MMIALINGSPKVKNSASGALLEDVKGYLLEKAEVIELEFHTAMLPDNAKELLEKADVWVFAFPLYVDGIPGHLLSCLMQIEELKVPISQVHVYGIANCGFYEGVQNDLALEVLENWCIKIGCTWGGGVGIGGGGSLAQLPKLAYGQGPKASVDFALHDLTESMLQGKAQENQFISVGMPRFLYKLAAQMGWRQEIKAYGGKRRDLGKKY